MPEESKTVNVSDFAGSTERSQSTGDANPLTVVIHELAVALAVRRLGSALADENDALLRDGCPPGTIREALRHLKDEVLPAVLAL